VADGGAIVTGRGPPRLAAALKAPALPQALKIQTKTGLCARSTWIFSYIFNSN
jgi:hypothetical protein